LSHARLGAGVVPCERFVFLDRAPRFAALGEGAGIQQMTVGQAQVRVLLSEVVERRDRVRVAARAELSPGDREQQLRVVLEHAGARHGADLDGSVEPSGVRERVGEATRGLDVWTALVVERAFA